MIIIIFPLGFIYFHSASPLRHISLLPSSLAMLTHTRTLYSIPVFASSVVLRRRALVTQDFYKSCTFIIPHKHTERGLVLHVKGRPPRIVSGRRMFRGPRALRNRYTMTWRRAKRAQKEQWRVPFYKFLPSRKDVLLSYVVNIDDLFEIHPRLRGYDN